MDQLSLHQRQEMPGLRLDPDVQMRFTSRAGILLTSFPGCALQEANGWKGITACNYWCVFPWVCIIYIISL